MNNRTEEYWDLIQELAQPPQKLEGSVQRARKRARRAQLLHKLATPAAALASAAACFVLMVNAFPTFALACSGIPIVRELTAAVALSPSLSAAVEHEYVQYIGQSQTIDGVTVSLEYAIVDRVEAIFFYSVDGGRFYTSPGLIDLSGKRIGGYGVSSFRNGRGQQDGLNAVTLDFTDGNDLPDRFTMEMFFIAEEQQELTPPQAASPAYAAPPETSADHRSDEWGDPREDPGVLCFTFDVALDKSRLAEPIIVPVNRWMELDGQRFLVDRLQYTPTRTILYLGEDAANTAWLKSLNFWFEDENGTRYDNIDGSISALGSESKGSKSYLTYYFQSFYYNQPKELTLCVGKTGWLDKNAPHVFLDLSSGACSGLPDGVSVGEITRTGKSVAVKFLSPLERQEFGQLFDYGYWDPEGGRHDFNQLSSGGEWNDQNEQTACYQKIYLDDCPWDTVELELIYTSFSAYEQPVRVQLIPEG